MSRSWNEVDYTQGNNVHRPKPSPTPYFPPPPDTLPQPSREAPERTIVTLADHCQGKQASEQLQRAAFSADDLSRQYRGHC